PLPADDDSALENFVHPLPICADESCHTRESLPRLRGRYEMVNPDGCQLGLRANARGVDLNRNFPAANWKQGETVYRWNSAAA
ncbi:M14 family zinc carboxypeptidase, partial [Klebsiella pneumoniae]|uniref:M14 family zinc carboxypeptidase n=1 Tax=Klebsiella pneumoniae TaxID=573 RepID=UPI0022B3710C